MTEVIEYAQFTLKAGVGDARLKAAAEELNEGFLKRQPGYLRRELVRLEGSTYADLIWWRSRAEAEAAMARAAESPVCASYFGVMDLNPDNPAEAVRHYSVVAAFS